MKYRRTHPFWLNGSSSVVCLNLVKDNLPDLLMLYVRRYLHVRFAGLSVISGGTTESRVEDEGYLHYYHQSQPAWSKQFGLQSLPPLMI